MSEGPASDETQAVAAGTVVQTASDGFARRSLLRRLMDVVALPSSRGNLQDRAIAGDLLLEILIESDVGARELCARRLQEMSQAPKRLLRFLALDAPHVAQIILADNKAFDDADLAYIVAHGATPHRVSVAHRREIGPAVALAIAESGDTVAMKALLENTGAKLSDRSVELIVSASRNARDLCPLLILREELRPAHALAMFWWAEAAERRQVLLRFSAERSLLLEMCSDIFRYAATEGYSDPAVRKALQVIERRQRDRAAIARSSHESLEAAIDAAAQKGMDQAAMAEISALSGIKASTGERIFQDYGGEGIAVLCKATGLKRPYLKQLWIALGRVRLDNDFAFNRVSEVYESIAVAKAQTVLRYWNWSLSSAFSPDAIVDEDQDASAAGIVRDLWVVDDELAKKTALGL
ncbi:MAG TPA: DUF2336 domain-containing protein [Hyphomonadaceae bacterium]|nr:DUF2336 domain-containing protein [Hyphomonadaceae bacterium]